MAMIKTVLENNVFEFDGNEYIQTEGVAIAPSWVEILPVHICGNGMKC